jgi:hypothetical protein
VGAQCTLKLARVRLSIERRHAVSWESQGAFARTERTAAVSLYLLWQRHLYDVVAVMWIPSIFVSAMFIRFGKFEK